MLTELKALRQRLGLTQQQVANELGITRQAYSNYESGLREPEVKMLCRLADVLRCPLSHLVGHQSEFEAGGTRVPILGTVKGGYNRLAQEEFEGYETADVANPDEYFYLRVTGDSMAPEIQEGDLALIHSQERLENGEIGVFLLEDDEATVKRFVLAGRNVILQPFNNAYTPIVLSGGQCRVLGKVVRTVRDWE